MKLLTEKSEEKDQIIFSINQMYIEKSSQYEEQLHQLNERNTKVPTYNYQLITSQQN